MAKVLLIIPHSQFKEKRNRVNHDLGGFPTGVLYVARALLDDGHDVQILDALAENINTERVKERLVELSATKTFDFIGISAFATHYAYVKWLCGELKQLFGDLPIIVGGPLAINSYDILLKRTAADIACTGEGETTVVEFANRKSLEDVRGIAYRKDGKIMRTPPAPLIEDFTKQGFPPYHLLPMELYLDHMTNVTRIVNEDGSVSEEKLVAFNVEAGRGCPFKCTFCARSFTKIRLKPIEYVKTEIDWFTRTYPEFNYLIFHDDLAFHNRKRANDLIDLMMDYDLNWYATSRLTFPDPALLKKARSSGCLGLSLGLENASQRLLNNVKKGIKATKARQVIIDILGANMHAGVQMIFGLPGEDDESVEDNIRFFDGLPMMVGYGYMTPLPGFPLYDEALTSGLIKDEETYLLGLEEGFVVMHSNTTDWPDEVMKNKRAYMTNQINYKGFRQIHNISEEDFNLIYKIRASGSANVAREYGGLLKMFDELPLERVMEEIDFKDVLGDGHTISSLLMGEGDINTKKQFFYYLVNRLGMKTLVSELGEDVSKIGELDAQIKQDIFGEFFRQKGLIKGVQEFGLPFALKHASRHYMTNAGRQGNG